MNKLTLTLSHALAAAIVASVVVATVGCGGGLSQSKTPTFTKLAFFSTRATSPATNLFLMNLDGSAVTPVPSGTGNLYAPSVSANLTTIAFTLSENLWASDEDGGIQSELTTTGSTYSERLSPDGTKIVFNQLDTNTYDMWIMNVDGTGALNLTSTMPTGMSDCYGGSFSADGTKIVMNCSGDSLSGVFVIHSDGTSLATVTTSPAYVDTPVFTPDGTKILFIEYANQSGLVSVNLDGSGQTSVAPTAFEAEILNATLYYTAYDQNLENNRIYKANLDGTSPVALTDGTSNDFLATSTD